MNNSIWVVVEPIDRGQGPRESKIWKFPWYVRMCMWKSFRWLDLWHSGILIKKLFICLCKSILYNKSQLETQLGTMYLLFKLVDLICTIICGKALRRIQIYSGPWILKSSNWNLKVVSNAKNFFCVPLKMI